MYSFSELPLADHVIAAHDRGVAVRVILDAGESGNDSIRQRFAQNSVPTRNAPAIYTYAHAKYMVLDGETGVIMSMNFDSGAMNDERNYGFVDRDAEDVADLQRIHTMDWAAGGDQAPRPANLACTRLIVSPDNSLARVLAVIGGAQHTLDIEAQYITDSQVSSAVVAAALRGVAVRVILEDPAQQAGNGDVGAAFGSAGIPVQYAVAQFYVHAKLIVADGVPFIGSENYSQTSLSMNREVGGLVFESDSAQIVQAQFAADWVSTGE
jgi:phosphatidylserine/phosphatidylglycerophosphate/cardiolipin synthase-like enzyme